MYKLCTIVNDRYYSYFAKGIWRLEYHVGEWTYPAIGKLFVYTSIDEALGELKATGRRDLAVFKCNVVDPEVVTGLAYFMVLWEQYWNHRYSSYVNSPVTVCGGIRLVERI